MTEPKTRPGTETNKGGRPTTYTEEIAAELCSYLSQGESLRKACAHEGMPSVKTIFNWFRVHDEFLQQYTRAKEEAADAMAEEILDIADDGDNDFVEDSNGNVRPNNANIQRDRLRVDTRKFLMAKMKPKKYGEKLDLTSGGDKIERGMSIEEINAVLARAEKEEAARKTKEQEEKAASNTK